MKRSALALSLTMLASTAFALPPHGAQPMRAPSSDATPNATVVQGCATPKLSYSNGPLIQKVKVFDVFYSPGNPYVDMLASFYTAITQSAYFDWLVEYNTTNYKISHGSYIGKFQDTNPATTATLNDTGATGSVQAYLQALIAAKKVPAPDDDTIYMIYFPSQVTIKLGQSSSCQQFCAYHSSMTIGTQLVRYGVMPDVTAGACAQGCGPNSGFLNVTDVSSHELIEAVTDPDNGTGWYDNVDNNCGEIGDICATNAGETAAVGSFTVQKEWSNAFNDCIVMSPNQFAAASSLQTVSVPVGGTATATITLTKKAGAAEMAKLSATAPTGVTATLSAATVSTDNGTAMLTVNAGSATAGTTGKITVTAQAATSQSTVDVSVDVVGPPDMATAPPVSSGGGGSGGGTGGNGNSGGSGGAGSGGGGSGATMGGCSVGGAGIGGAWIVAALLLAALAFRRRRA